jgi:hypothetical protein
MLEFIEQQMINAQNNITKVYNVIDKTLATVSSKFQLGPDAIAYNKDRDAYVAPIAKDKSVFCAITHTAQTVTVEVLDVDLTSQTEIPIGQLIINTNDQSMIQSLRLSEIDTTSEKANSITSLFCEVAQVIKKRNDPEPEEEKAPEVEIVEDPSKPKDETIA